MLRILVVVLVLANGLYFAWAQGHLNAWSEALGLGEPPSTRPTASGKSAQYTPVNPEAIVWVAATEPMPVAPPPEPAQPVRTPAVDVQEDQSEAGGEVPAEPEAEPVEQVQAQEPEAPEPIAASAPTVPTVPKQCMAIGVFSEEQMAPIREALQGIARNQWRLKDSPVSGRWMVFWGGANDELDLVARRSELQSKSVPHERLRTSPVGIGYSLGRFSSEAAAQQHQKDVERKGIRGTTVEVERQPSTIYTLEFPDYNAIKDILRRDLGRHIGARTWQRC